MCHKVLLLPILIILLFVSCETPIEEIIGRSDEIVFQTAYTGEWYKDTSYFDYAKGVENALKKVQHIANISWKPLADIPKGNGVDNSFFYAGHNYRGLPYSSVKEVDTYIGHNVSFYTFMSSLNNCRSRIYTEDLWKAPYHGGGGATYYGTVCSMSVNYALGIDAPFICRDYPSIGFEAIDPQSMDAIKVCDVLWRSGHTMMIYDVEYEPKSSLVSSVSIFEVNSIKKYSRDEFLSKWKEGNYSLLRYKYLGGNLDYTPNPFVPVGDEQIQEVNFNLDICPDKGDMACYRREESVIIDVLNPVYTTVIVNDLYGTCVKQADVVNGECIINDLQPGIYEALACNDSCFTNSVKFEVVDIVASVERLNNTIIVHFESSNAQPRYIILCNEYGNKFALKRLTFSEISAGVAKLGWPDKVNDCYVKVAFEGEFGIITNFPILVN